jgi:hypothetical protein
MGTLAGAEVGVQSTTDGQDILIQHTDTGHLCRPGMQSGFMGLPNRENHDLVPPQLNNRPSADVLRVEKGR